MRDTLGGGPIAVKAHRGLSECLAKFTTYVAVGSDADKGVERLEGPFPSA